MTAAPKIPKMPDLVFVDVETTGLDPTEHEVIEVAAIRVDARTLRLRSDYTSRIAPTHPQLFDPEAAAVNGYDPDTWGGAPLEEVCCDLAPHLDGAILAGQNVGFDEAFVRRMYAVAGQPAPKWRRRRLDTMTYGLVLQSMDIASSASLDGLCAAHGLERRSPHRAYDDALACLMLVRYLRETLAAGRNP